MIALVREGRPPSTRAWLEPTAARFDRYRECVESAFAQPPLAEHLAEVTAPDHAVHVEVAGPHREGEPVEVVGRRDRHLRESPRDTALVVAVEGDLAL